MKRMIFFPCATDDGIMFSLFREDLETWSMEFRNLILINARCALCSRPIQENFNYCGCSRDFDISLLAVDRRETYSPDDLVGIYIIDGEVYSSEKFTETLNQARRRGYSKKSSKTRQERLKASAGSYSEKDIQILRHIQGERCYYCGHVLVQYQVDHQVPLSEGGTNFPKNLVLACQNCNKSKYNTEPSDFWAKIRNRFSAEEQKRLIKQRKRIDLHKKKFF